MTKETKDLGAAPPHAPPEVDPHEGPTEQQCSNHECVAYNEEVGYAIWYPQMGGYVGKAIVFDGGSQPSGCFEAVVWHDGEFPFGDGEPVSIHHCDAEQFVRFGTTVERLLFGNAAEPPPDSSSALLEARGLLHEALDSPGDHAADCPGWDSWEMLSGCVCWVAKAMALIGYRAGTAAAQTPHEMDGRES